MAGLLRVLTLNLWNLSGPVADRIPEARRWVELLEPDVLCLQELVVKVGDPGTHYGIWDGLGYELALCPVVPFGDAGTFGNGIVTRLPIESHEVHDLPGLDRDENRKVQIATLGLPGGGPVVIANTHLNWHFDEGYVREAQVVEVDRLVREAGTGLPPGAQPPILYGDFNAEPTSTEVRFLAGLASLHGHSTGYQDCWLAKGAGEGHTWDNRNPFASSAHEPRRRIDYVWAGLPDPPHVRGRVFHARVVCDEVLTGTHASDHYGVYAEVHT